VGGVWIFSGTAHSIPVFANNSPIHFNSNEIGCCRTKCELDACLSKSVFNMLKEELTKKIAQKEM